MSVKIDIEEFAIAVKLKKTAHLLLNDSKKAFQLIHCDFDPNLFPVLNLILNHEKLSIKKISKLLNVTHPATVQMVKKLVGQKMAETYELPDDRRFTFVRITEKGREQFKTMETVAMEINEACAQIINEVDPQLIFTLENLEKKLSSGRIYERVKEMIKENQLKSVKIVRYSPVYKTAFQKLNLEWLEKYFEVEEEDRKALDDPESYYIKNGGEIFFAIIDGNIVGTCALRRTESGSFELSKMGVNEQYQGIQVGKKLALTAIGFAYEKEAGKIFLETNTKLKAAISLYKKLGFEIVKDDFPAKYKRELFRMELKFK